MTLSKISNRIMLAALLCLLAGAALFFHDTAGNYTVNMGFESLPLQFDPEDSSSSYNLGGADVKIYGGFVKGIQKGIRGEQMLVLRALSPLPSITVSTEGPVSLLLENINPDLYAGCIKNSGVQTARTAANTLRLTVDAAPGAVNIEPDLDAGGEYSYVILGDNRDGYGTFEQIIAQVNGLGPAFVIDNGDLVYSGKTNQYRLFDEMASQIASTLCTTLGNHDIRDDGRATYTMLYGPAYYSFDFAGSHFAFLDSSPGWSETRAISDEQYEWLERDLQKAQGKQIFVITHVPPEDPRSGTAPNEIPDYADEVKNGNSWVEQKLNNYNENKDMEHGFQDPQEAARFEGLMSRYHVDTVYLSHIHSNLEYYKDSVRYLITGGAGAELLTKNSYYHYLISKVGAPRELTMVELPSPANDYIARYRASVKLFARAIYRENPGPVILGGCGLGLFIVLLIVKIYFWRKRFFDRVYVWLRDIFKYSGKRFKEVLIKKSGNSRSAH